MKKINLDNLVIGDTVKPKEMKSIIQGLRVMVRLGNRAKRALNALEQGEEFDESFPYVWARETYGRNVSVCEARLSSCSGISHRLGVTREDFPGYKDMKLLCGPTHEGKHGGSKFREFTVKVKSRVIHVDENKGKVTVKKLRKREVIVGYVRIKRNGTATFKPTEGYRKVAKLYRDVDQPNAQDSVDQFVSSLVGHLILDGTYGDKPPEIVELEQSLPEWIAVDYVEDWFGQMLDHAKSIITVEAVMES